MESFLSFLFSGSREWFLDFFLSIFAGTLAGGILGFERELSAKPAGLKTIVFVTVGSTIFSFMSFELGRFFGGDPLRIASNIATGIGFLGAGTIIRRGEWVEGLTTASIIWFCGALGIVIGAGYFSLGVLASLGGLFFLKTLEFIEVKVVRKCVPVEVRATFSGGKREDIFSALNEFRPNCPKVFHKVLIFDKGDKIDVEMTLCSHHTKDIPLLRSAEKYEVSSR